MNAKAQMSLAAKWLVVVLTGLLLLDSGAAKASTAPQKQTCSACVRCTCCVKQAPVDTNAPLAPTPASRNAVQKDFQLLTAISALLAQLRESCATSSTFFSSVSVPASAPLYQRHCTYLI